MDFVTGDIEVEAAACSSFYVVCANYENQCISVEPRLAGQSYTIEAFEGQSVTLHCGLVGLPGGSSVANTSVRWSSGSKGGKLIPIASNSFIKYNGADLLFVTARKADSANYTCQPDDAARKLITGAVTYRLKVKGMK